MKEISEKEFRAYGFSQRIADIKEKTQKNRVNFEKRMASLSPQEIEALPKLKDLEDLGKEALSFSISKEAFYSRLSDWLALYEAVGGITDPTGAMSLKERNP